MAEHKEKRVALIIGNARYHYACRLNNPQNDAIAVGKAFGRLGFRSVGPRLDLGYNKFRFELQKFARLADNADMAVIYFAGHGIEVSQKNFLIPVDAKLTRSKDVEYEAITLDQILTSVDGARVLRLVILDACRNNPFRARMLRSGERRSIGEGLREVQDPGNVLVAYAAKHGTTALDGKGKNSPYVEALLSHIEKPGLEIIDLFREVRDDVLERTDRQQEPHTYGSLGRKKIFFICPPIDGDPQPPAPPPPTPPFKTWHKVIAAAGAVAVIATPIALLPLPLREAMPDPRKQIRELKALADRQGPGAEAARKELGGRGFVPVQVKRGNTTREFWIEAGGGKEAGEAFQDCWGEGPDRNQCGPLLVVVPPGDFQMGSPENEPLRYDDEDDTAGAGGQRVPITFKAAFAVGKFEITFAQWSACLDDGGCKIGSTRAHGEQRDQPVVNVSWKDITDQYLPWLNTKVAGNPDGPYRLLSEAEWEYAARARTSSPYSFGDSIDSWQANANASYTLPANALAANPWGLHHVHGNVWEWVQDRYLDSYGTVRSECNFSQDVSQGTRVVRGGSFTNQAGDLRSARRLSVPSYSRIRDIGFRIARTLAP
jgi:formylglycine-generating enzyme required for sulfatase activity/uncharacterized caspase-like protein